MKKTQNDATSLMCSTIGVLDERSRTHPDFHLSSARTESLVIMLVEYELGAELPLHKQKDVVEVLQMKPLVDENGDVPIENRDRFMRVTGRCCYGPN